MNETDTTIEKSTEKDLVPDKNLKRHAKKAGVVEKFSIWKNVKLPDGTITRAPDEEAYKIWANENLKWRVRAKAKINRIITKPRLRKMIRQNMQNQTLRTA